MKTKLYTLLGLIAILFMAPSCNKNNVEEATLEVSKKEIKFTKAAGEETITVNASAENWIASSPVEGQWLTLTKEGTNLKIKVAANEKGVSRKSYVLINAGAIAERIDVEQSAADLVLSTNPTDVVAPMAGGQYSIDVDANTDNWEAEMDDKANNWVTLSIKKVAGTILVTVAENKTGKDRSAKIILKSGNTLKEVAVKQFGTASKYLLPIFLIAPTQHELINAEKIRGNHLLSYSSAFPAWGINEDTYLFVTPSSVFPAIEYGISFTSGKVAYARMSSADKEAVMSKDFLAVLKEAGFVVEKNTAAGFSAVSDSKSYRVDVVYDNKGVSVVTYAPIIKQTKEYPTFKKFPYGSSVRLGKMKIADIKKADATDYVVSMEEKAKKSEEIGFLLMTHKSPKDNDEIIDAKASFFDWDAKTPADKKGLLQECMDVQLNYNLGVWRDGNAFILTNEFKDLLLKEGFAFVKDNGGKYFFYKAADKLMVVVRGAMFKDLLDQKPVLALSFFTYEEQGASIHAMTKEGMEARIKMVMDFEKRNRF